MIWIAALLLALAALVVARRERALARRFEELSDRSIDWRLRLARRQEEIGEELAAVRGRLGMPPREDSTGGPPQAPDGLLQIRGRK